MKDRYKLLISNLKSDIYEDIKTKLNELNIDVTMIKDDKEALRFIKDEKPDVLLIDSAEDDMKSLDLMRKGRLLDPEIEVLFLTTKNREKKIKDLRPEENFEYMVKPVTPLELYSGIKKGIIKKQRIQEYLKLCIIDVTTTAYNEAYFRMRLAEEVIRAERYKKIFSLIMFNMINFNDLLDEYGVEHADKLLKSLFMFLSKYTRETDILARLHRDIFGILLPETNLSGAILAAERIRNLLFDNKIKVESNNFLIQLNFGITVYLHSEDSPNSLLEKSNFALMEANKNRESTIYIVDQM